MSARVYPYARPSVRTGAMKRSYMSRTTTRYKRRRRGNDIGEYRGELTFSKRRQGRLESRYSNKYARHMIRSTVERAIYGMQNWSSYGGQYGAVPILNYYDSATPKYTLPVHLYDLTCAPNNVGGTVQTAQCGWQLTADNVATSGANFSWRALGNPVDVIRTSHTTGSTASYPNGASLLRGASVKLMLYAPTGIPCKYVINLVQFPDEDFAPQSVVTSGTVANAGVWSAEGTILNTLSTTQASWWMNKLQGFAKNPVVHTFREGAPKMRVVYSKTIIMNPKETTEVVNTKYHQFNLFKALNQKCVYNYEADKRWNILDNSTEVTETADNKCCIHPTKRTYLMIRCLGNFGSSAAGFPGMNTDITIGGAAAKPYTAFGSYDLSLRLYHDDLAA